MVFDIHYPVGGIKFWPLREEGEVQEADLDDGHYILVLCAFGKAVMKEKNFENLPYGA